MRRVAVLGKTGMLGSTVYNILKSTTKYDVIGTTRKELDVQSVSINDLKIILKNCDYIINCIGLIKPYIHDNNHIEVEHAININALFPYKLAAINEAKIIQIATDCVYDGIKGNYVETDKHNALDVYGKTKSLGEVRTENFLNLRCSIIGFETSNKKSLLEWFINQDSSARINGYQNHFWNGITTIAFAKICKGIIENNKWFYGLQHILPNDVITKAGLLKVFAETFNRKDIVINNIDAEERINRSICTENALRNKELWMMAGYNKIPDIDELVAELKQYE
jgi:dTDP-4-dehydrorhamnose reductase